jgi:hypothetical protein
LQQTLQQRREELQSKLSELGETEKHELSTLPSARAG